MVLKPRRMFIHYLQSKSKREFVPPSPMVWRTDPYNPGAWNSPAEADIPQFARRLPLHNILVLRLQLNLWATHLLPAKTIHLFQLLWVLPPGIRYSNHILSSFQSRYIWLSWAIENLWSLLRSISILSFLLQKPSPSVCIDIHVTWDNDSGIKDLFPPDHHETLDF